MQEAQAKNKRLSMALRDAKRKAGGDAESVSSHQATIRDLQAQLAAALAKAADAAKAANAAAAAASDDKVSRGAKVSGGCRGPRMHNAAPSHLRAPSGPRGVCAVAVQREALALIEQVRLGLDAEMKARDGVHNLKILLKAAENAEMRKEMEKLAKEVEQSKEKINIMLYNVRSAEKVVRWRNYAHTALFEH